MQRRPRRAREPAQLGGAWLARGPLRDALPQVTPLSQDQVEASTTRRSRILEEGGIEFQGAGACEAFRKAGAMVKVTAA